MLKLIVTGVLLFLLWILFPVIKVAFFHDFDNVASISDTNNDPGLTDSEYAVEDFTSDSEPKTKIKQQQKIGQSTPKKTQYFTCDGRQYCSQMRSYEEAKYFLDHCGTPRHPMKMDGNGDGIPCERQFGRH